MYTFVRDYEVFRRCFKIYQEYSPSVGQSKFNSQLSHTKDLIIMVIYWGGVNALTQDPH